MLKILILCAISSFYSDWLGPGHDINGDGITNLQDWSIIQNLDVGVLKRKPSVEDVKRLVVELYRLDAFWLLEDHYTITKIVREDGKITVFLVWDGGWFGVVWEYSAFRYKFTYQYFTEGSDHNDN
jgi:hypothetical protein